MLKRTILLIVPFFASLILALILTYMYHKDRNKRKLVFAIGVFVSSFGFYNVLFESFGVKPIFPSANWLFMPMTLAVLVAAMSSLFKVKDFERPFALFMTGTGLALIAYFTQFSFGSLCLELTVAFMSFALPTLIYLFAKSRDFADLNFLLATLCFLFQGIEFDLGGSEDISVLLSLFGVVFVALMFNTPKTGNVSAMASFVVLEKKLDEANQNLHSMEEKLLEAERLAAIGELAGMIGHDLRNPLQGVVGAAYYLKTHSVDQSDVTALEMIENIETCVTRSNKIINDLVEYAQVIHLQLSEMNPKSLTDNALSQIEAPVNIEILNQTISQPLLNIDRERVERVFVSIIRNAFDAMLDGGKLTIESKITGSIVVFNFKDTGTGMTKEVMSKIWTPLFTTKAKGMGFGLAICKRIIEAHGGEIKAETELGKGSKFTVSLPFNLTKNEE